MNYLSAENLSFAYGDRILFENLTFGVSKGEKVALVAENGAGKSTLLKILEGLDHPDQGGFSFRKDITVGFLPQDPQTNPQKTILEECLKEGWYQGHNDHEIELWQKEAKAKEMLDKLGLKNVHQPCGLLSGGQKKRLALAAVLCGSPDFLILDEPTNHLDIEMIEWLEDYLVRGNFTLLMVTHDRYFLDRVCERIIELDKGIMQFYQGGYSYFIEKRAMRMEVLAAENEKLKNAYHREIEWVRRMPKARGTKSKSRLEQFDQMEEKLKSQKSSGSISLSVKSTRLGNKILELQHIEKAYPEVPIINDLMYTFRKGEKIGVVGKNGSGKSTLLRMIMEQERPDKGKIIKGETVVFGYFAQEGAGWKPDKKVIDVVRDIAEFIPMADGSKLYASQLLQRFLFAPDKQYQSVSKLSGGERRRLQLLEVLISNPNFLILDEPTNDLDITTLSVLEDFLAEYDGCILAVSHDRFFLDKIADHIFAFEGQGTVKDFPGNYSEYRSWKDTQDEEVKRRQEEAKQQINSAEKKSIDKEKSKLTYKDKFEFEQLEKSIPDLQNKKKELEHLVSITTHYEELKPLLEQLKQITYDLDLQEMRWLEISEKM